MPQESEKPQRYRGISLTESGCEKVQTRLQDLEKQKGIRFTAPKIAEQTQLKQAQGLHADTVRKILNRQGGVDISSLQLLFQTLQLDLEERDYHSARLPEQMGNPKAIVDWGEASDVSVFYGRTEELGQLQSWILDQHCRVVLLLGMGGIGKTSLSIKLADQLQSQFERVVWRSLRHAPPIEDHLSDLIRSLTQPHATELPETQEAGITRLIELLKRHSCLLILDNLESILAGGHYAGQYRSGYEGYGELIRRLGESAHRSCVVMTSREKPAEIAALEGETLPIRSLLLPGLKAAARELLQAKGVTGSEQDQQVLIDYYQGNPLALKIVSTSIQEIFGGDIASFLAEGTAVFNGLRLLLNQQFERLTEWEQQVMVWLALNREAVSLPELVADLAFPIAKRQLLECLESLRHRSLIERSIPESAPSPQHSSKRSTRFTQQPVVMEYVTDRLLEGFYQELSQDRADGPFSWMGHYALLKATAKDYIRDSQTRVILQPLIARLSTHWRTAQELERRLKLRLHHLQQGERGSEPGYRYAAGNLLNLLCQLNSDLSGITVSHLPIWQAYLQDQQLHQVDFRYADLSRSVFTQAFGMPLTLCFSADGSLLAVGDSLGEITLWRLQKETGGPVMIDPLCILKGHRNWVRTLAFAPAADGRRSDLPLLVSGSEDQTLKLWDLPSGQCLKTLQGHRNWIRAIAFHPNGRLFASGSEDHTLKLWDCQSGECLQTLPGHEGGVWALAFRPEVEDGSEVQILASGSVDHTIKLWDLGKGQCWRTLEGHTHWIRSLVFLHQLVLASSSEDSTIRLWNVETGDCLAVLQGHSFGVFGLAWDPIHSVLASASGDRSVRLWDIPPLGEDLHAWSDAIGRSTLLSGHSNLVCGVVFDLSHAMLASCSYDRTIRLWDMPTKQCLKTVHGYVNEVLSVAALPNSATAARLITGSTDAMLRLWDPLTGHCVDTWRGHTDALLSVLPLPPLSGQNPILASAGADRSIRLWDLTTGKLLKTLLGHQEWIWCMAGQVINGSLRLASGSNDNQIMLWDPLTGSHLKTLQGHTYGVTGLVWSAADPTLLLSCSLDRTLKVWDTATGTCLRTLTGHTGRIWSLCTDPCSHERVISGSEDGSVRLWDRDQEDCLLTLEAHSDWVRAVASARCRLSDGHDHCLVASASEDQAVKLWDLETGECLHTFLGHTYGLRGVTFAEEGQTLVTVSADECIKWWDVQSGQCRRTVRIPRPYEGLKIKGVTGLTEAARATLLALGADDQE